MTCANARVMYYSKLKHCVPTYIVLATTAHHLNSLTPNKTTTITQSISNINSIHTATQKMSCKHAQTHQGYFISSIYVHMHVIQKKTCHLICTEKTYQQSKKCNSFLPNNIGPEKIRILIHEENENICSATITTIPS